MSVVPEVMFRVFLSTIGCRVEDIASTRVTGSAVREGEGGVEEELAKFEEDRMEGGSQLPELTISEEGSFGWNCVVATGGADAACDGCDDCDGCC